ncbi:MAG: hypothetical protein AAFR17_13690 [Pseudomonadota bacterium]
MTWSAGKGQSAEPRPRPEWMSGGCANQVFADMAQGQPMRLVLPLILVLLMPALPAQAQTRCAIEPTEAGRAACLGLQADLKLVALEARLARVTGQVQGASVPAISALERGLAADQARWRRATERGCRSRATPLARETCRLDAVTARSAEIDTLLAEAFAPIGGIPGEVDLPEDVEVRIPLGRGPNGTFPFIDLDIPLTR